MNNIKCLLLDLDGTLLHVDMHRFLPAYINSLIPWVKDYINAENFADALMASTGVMVNNTDPDKTNEQVFYEDFSRRVGYSPEVLYPIFSRYYQEGFSQLRKFAAPSPEASALLQAANCLNLRLVLATNPVFPETAIRQRMDWGDLLNQPFELITCLENMHFCKPQQSYYQEILKEIGLHPQECIMAGNDFGEDIIPAKALGLKTFLVTGTLLINKTGQVPNPDGKGSLTDLTNLLQSYK